MATQPTSLKKSRRMKTNGLLCASTSDMVPYPILPTTQSHAFTCSSKHAGLPFCQETIQQAAPGPAPMTSPYHPHPWTPA